MLRLAMLVLLVASTGAATAQGVDPALTGGTWRVVEIESVPAAFGETLQFDAEKIAGTGACNRFTVGVKQTGQTLAIGKLASTRKFCDGKMDAEERYFVALSAVRSYALSGATLSLLAADGRTLVTLARQT